MGLTASCVDCGAELRPYDDWDAQPCRKCLIEEIEQLKRAVSLAVGLLHNRNRLTWSPDGWWIDRKCYSADMEESLLQAARMQEEQDG